MKMLKLVHQHTGKEILVNWNNVLFCAGTETVLGESYTAASVIQVLSNGT